MGACETKNDIVGDRQSKRRESGYSGSKYINSQGIRVQDKPTYIP